MEAGINLPVFPESLYGYSGSLKTAFSNAVVLLGHNRAARCKKGMVHYESDFHCYDL